MEEEFEPLLIRNAKMGMPGMEYRLDIAKYTVRAIEFACKHHLKYIVACNVMSPTIGGLNVVTSLAMDDSDYIENLDGCLPTLEENEEYELCAKVLELKKLVPTIKFKKKKIKRDILDVISDL
jgi:hypothetical protein